jgi:hypothetical protein
MLGDDTSLPVDCTGSHGQDFFQDLHFVDDERRHQRIRIIILLGVSSILFKIIHPLEGSAPSLPSNLGNRNAFIFLRKQRINYISQMSQFNQIISWIGLLGHLALLVGAFQCCINSQANCLGCLDQRIVPPIRIVGWVS